jgi:hypothetical protein
LDSNIILEIKTFLEKEYISTKIRRKKMWKDYIKAFVEKEVGDHVVDAAAIGLKQKCLGLNKVTYVCMVKRKKEK